MKLVPRHHQGHEVGVLMTSLLLIVGAGTLLLPLASGGTAKRKDVKCYTSYYSKPYAFYEDQTCGKADAENEEEACCFFIFSFGEVRTEWNCGSEEKENLDLCEGANGKCVKNERDPSERSVRCVCTAPLCNRPETFAKDPVFLQWKNHPENEKKGTGPKEKGTVDKAGGVSPAGGKGNLATVTLSALLVIVTVIRLSSASNLLVTLGATLLLLLPSAVSAGEGDHKAVNLTCLSSSKASWAWGDRHCGIDTETCCYYIFREIPTWGCSLLSYCDVSNYGDGTVGKCEERWDGFHASLDLLCHCNTDGCNHPEAWLEDRDFKRWKQGIEYGRTTQRPSGGGAAGKTDNFLTLLLVLKEIFAIIF